MPTQPSPPSPPRPRFFALAAFAVAALLCGGFAPRAAAQNERFEENGVIHNNFPVETPSSTIEGPNDRGIRAHSNHYILLRPEKSQQAVTAKVPAGEAPGSLACLYQTSAASLSTGCPISGNFAAGNNGLPNPVGGSHTIAIVDAYDYPSAYADLSTFSRQFGLPVLPLCTTSVTTACFAQVYAAGPRPAANASWALEEALDIEWAHAMAPNARIVLVEASSNRLSALFEGVIVASEEVTANGGSGEVSMSWASSEFNGETSYDRYFQTPGVVYFAAAGDSGSQTNYPSVSPYVVSAGGSSVGRNTSGLFVSESAWSNAGGGSSAYEPRPSFQSGVQNLVGSHRGTPDLSFDADPNTGVFVYDSTAYDGSAGWWLIGGTSVSTPALAGVVNLAGVFHPSSSVELSGMYAICSSGPSTHCSNADFRDITAGSTGHFNSALGWDFTTGLGSSVTKGDK